MGASDSYIYQVIICQALLSAIIGFAIAALIGATIVHSTAKSALQVVISPSLIVELFVLTNSHVHRLGDCRDLSRRPRRSCDCADPMTEPVIEAANVSRSYGSGPAWVQA